MKFRWGQKVWVKRGSPGRPPGTMGCLRLVLARVVSHDDHLVRARLLVDDPYDSVGWRDQGVIGFWSQSAVTPVERT